jgi:hypothetical protein
MILSKKRLLILSQQSSFTRSSSQEVIGLQEKTPFHVFCNFVEVSGNQQTSAMPLGLPISCLPWLHVLRLPYVYTPRLLCLDVLFVFPALVSTPDVSEPQASGDILALYDVLIPVSVVVWVDLDSSERPKFFAFPNIDPFPNPSSSFQVVGQESVRTSIGVHASDDLGSIFSNPGLHQSKTLGHRCNKPSPGHNSVNDTNDLPTNATTSHPRKTDQHLCLESHKHCPYRVAR